MQSEYSLAEANSDPAIESPSTVKSRNNKGARNWLWWFASFILLTLVAAFVGGLAAGWRLHDQSAASEAAPIPSVVTVTAAPSGPQGHVMPDVRGLAEDVARQVIADAGFSSVSIETSEKQWAGDEGLVVEQEPVFGVKSPSEVRLVLSAEATVPEALGRPAGEVAREASALGAQVTIVQKYEAGAEPGSVLVVEPAAGEPLPDTVTLAQATSPSSMFLQELPSLGDDCSNREVKLNGPTYDFGMECSVRESGESVWLLSRVVDSMEGFGGIPDTEDPAMAAQLQIKVDDTVVLDQALGYGQDAVPIDIDTRGALRLTVTITNLSEVVSSAVVGFGDVRLIGEAEAIGTLGDDQ